jgi:hypothetical protein
MGIINNDNYVCSNGVEKVGTYISFATETIYVVQNYAAIPNGSTNEYSVRANYRVFWDKDCREAGKSFIDLKSVSTVVTAEQLNNNVYTILYEELKKIYPNSIDEKSLAAASQPAAPSDPAAAPPS